MEIDVALVPHRESGMTPYEIMLSESQERMLAIVQKGREDEVASVFKKWGLNAVVIGHVTDDGLVRVRHHGEVVAEVPAKSLADECPTYQLEADEPAYIAAVRSRDAGDVPAGDCSQALLNLLARPTVASKRWVWEQYDHMVQTCTAIFPGSDAGVLRIRGIGKGIALTTDCNARQVYLDPYLGAKMAVYEGARNLACSGARAVAVTDCLNFGNPEKPEAFWQFKEAVRGIADACEELGTPVISGNVSFYNETPESAIHPTPVIGMLGVLDDVETRMSYCFKGEGDAVILLHAGWPQDASGGLAASELQAMASGELYGRLPDLREDKQRALHAVLLELSESGAIRSAHDVAEGGLAVCLAESAIAGGVGADVSLDAPVEPAAALFGEPAGFVIATASADAAAAIIETARARGIEAARVGVTGGSRLCISVNGERLVDVDLAAAAGAYQNSIGSIMDRS